MPNTSQISQGSDATYVSTPKSSKNGVGKDEVVGEGGGEVDGRSASKDTGKDVNGTSLIKNEGRGDEEELLNNPVEFWSAWSARQTSCMNSEHVGPNGKKLAVCSCFEGLGSVM